MVVDEGVDDVVVGVAVVGGAESSVVVVVVVVLAVSPPPHAPDSNAIKKAISAEVVRLTGSG